MHEFEHHMYPQFTLNKIPNKYREYDKRVKSNTGKFREIHGDKNNKGLCQILHKSRNAG